MSNLYQITGKESGIVIYPDFKLICNWLSVEGLPRIFAGNVFGMNEQLRLVSKSQLSKEDICKIIPEQEVSSNGTLWQIETDNERVLVITIDDWH